MPQVRALKTFNASRYGYLVRAGVIFSAEAGYADELARMGMVTILPDKLAPQRTQAAKAAPAGKDPPPGPPPPAPAPNPASNSTVSAPDDGRVTLAPSSRPARRSRRATAPLRVEYPTEPSR